MSHVTPFYLFGSHHYSSIQRAGTSQCNLPVDVVVASTRPIAKLLASCVVHPANFSLYERTTHCRISVMSLVNRCAVFCPFHVSRRRAVIMAHNYGNYYPPRLSGAVQRPSPPVAKGPVTDRSSRSFDHYVLLTMASNRTN